MRRGTNERAWHQGPLGYLDLETTGPDPKTALPVTAAYGVVHGARDPTNDRHIHYVIDPGVEIPAEATAVHGVTTERAREEGAPFKEAITRIAFFARTCHSDGVPIVIYNALYDWLIMHRLTDGGLPRCDIIDPLVLDRWVEPYRKGPRTLERVAARWHVDMAGDAHSADVDGIAAVGVARAIGPQHKDLDRLPARELQRPQRKMHAAWLKKMNTWRAKRGEDPFVHEVWPGDGRWDRS